MPFGRMAVTQEPSRSMAAVPSVLPMQRTGRLDAEAGDTMEASPKQEAKAACRILPVRRRELRKCKARTAADSSRGCPQNGRILADGRDARAVTEHGGGAIGVADATHGSAGRRGGDAMEASPKQEAKAACRILPVRHRNLRKRMARTAADSSRGCPQSEHLLADGREVRPGALRLDGRDARAVTEHGGGAIGVADATHESAGRRGGRRLESVVNAGSQSRLPYLVCTPPQFAEANGSDGCR